MARRYTVRYRFRYREEEPGMRYVVDAKGAGTPSGTRVCTRRPEPTTGDGTASVAQAKGD
jgi:hypothetical protein